MHLLNQYLQTQLGRAAPKTESPRGLRIFAEGFSLHAGVSVSELDGDSLERLARYCARPPLSLHRIAVDPDGQILYRAKHSAPGAPRRLHLSPTQFLGRIAALIPPPRSHPVSYTHLERAGVGGHDIELAVLVHIRKAELFSAACAYNSTQTPPKRPSDTFG